MEKATRRGYTSDYKQETAGRWSLASGSGRQRSRWGLWNRCWPKGQTASYEINSGQKGSSAIVSLKKGAEHQSNSLNRKVIWNV